MSTDKPTIPVNTPATLRETMELLRQIDLHLGPTMLPIFQRILFELNELKGTRT